MYMELHQQLGNTWALPGLCPLAGKKGEKSHIFCGGHFRSGMHIIVLSLQTLGAKYNVFLCPQHSHLFLPSQLMLLSVHCPWISQGCFCPLLIVSWFSDCFSVSDRSNTHTCLMYEAWTMACGGQLQTKWSYAEKSNWFPCCNLWGCQSRKDMIKRHSEHKWGNQQKTFVLEGMWFLSLY